MARQLRFWLAGLVLLLVALWLLRPVLLPFVAGLAVAYLFDPVADRLEKWGTSRTVATAAVLMAFAIALIGALLLLVPLLQAQLGQLVTMAPAGAAWLRDHVVSRVEILASRLPQEDVDRLRAAVGGYAGDAAGWLATVVRELVSRGLALFDVLSLLFVTPVVAFYLLRDWDHLVGAIGSWLPREHKDTILEQAAAIDRTLAGFVRGQATVCLVLGAFYALALTVAGLNFGLVVGLVAGLLSFIPYVGSMVGFVSSVGIALFQFGDPVRVGIVVGIFVLGQALEGQVLTPRLVGTRIGLHPVWLILALLAGGSLFGFLGILLAVPVAAVCGVLVRFLLRQYLASRYYTGAAP